MRVNALPSLELSVHALRVLVVDDDEAGRAMCVTAIRAAGYEVVEADSVEAALECYDAAQPSAVVLDLILPGRNGLDLLEYIRKTRGQDLLPVLVLTAIRDSAAVTRAYDAGATDFATKPIHPTVLSQRLRFLMRSYEMQARLNESQARLELAQSIARLGYFETSEGTWQITPYRTALGLLGRAEGQGPVSIDALLERVPVEERARVHGEWSRSQLAGAPLHAVHRLLCWDGQTRYLEFHGMFLPKQAGRPRRFLGTVQDVSERQATVDRIAYISEHDVLTGALNRKGLDEALTSVELRGMFDATRTADETASKPNPQMLLELMREFGVEPERTLMIGDTTHDLQLAVNAGVSSVGVSYGAHEPASFAAFPTLHVAHSTADLHAWLDQHG